MPNFAPKYNQKLRPTFTLYNSQISMNLQSVSRIWASYIFQWRFGFRLEPIFDIAPGVNFINVKHTNFLYERRFLQLRLAWRQKFCARKTLMRLTPAASENIVRFKSRQKRSKNNHLARTKAACKKIIKLTPNEENVKSYVLDLATSHISTKE